MDGKFKDILCNLGHDCRVFWTVLVGRTADLECVLLLVRSGIYLKLEIYSVMTVGTSVLVRNSCMHTIKKIVEGSRSL